MDRNREAGRATIVGSNGFNRRRHRTNSLRDSPEEDGGLELQETVRLRERVKKDRDRDRERDHRERERERDFRERSNRNKRRRANNRDDIAGDETSDESVNDDEDDEDEEDEESGPTVGGSGVRLVSPPVGSIPNHHHGGGSGSVANHHHSSNFGPQNNNIGGDGHHLHQRKTYPHPPVSSASKIFRSPPAWKSGDEMIGVSVPRKARTASTKRTNDWISSSSNNNSGGAVSGRDQTLRQDSPAATASPVSPSSNPSSAKKLKHTGNLGGGGTKPKPPKASSKPNSSNPEELEIEIAEVLYGLMTQSHGPSSKKEEGHRSNVDVKSRNSSPISNSSNLSNPSLGTNSCPLSVIAPKRKRPRQVPDSSGYGGRSKIEAEQVVKTEVSSPLQKPTVVENGDEIGAISMEVTEQMESKPSESGKMESDLKERRDFAVSSPKEKESLVPREHESVVKDLQATATGTASSIKSNLVASGKENLKDAKFQIDLMAPPSQTRSSPERDPPDGSITGAVVPPNLVLSMDSAALALDSSKVKENPDANEETGKEPVEEGDNGRIIDLQLDLEKPEREANSVRSKSLQTNPKPTQQQIQFKATREEPVTEKSGLVPLSMAGWPSGLPPMSYMTPLQGVVSMDGSSVAPPSHLQPLPSQPRPKRCATHCHIARNILFLQHFMKMSSFWTGSPAAASLFGSKSCGLPAPDLQGNFSLRGAAAYTSVDKGMTMSIGGGKEKSNQAASSGSSADSRKQQILIQPAMPPVPAGSLLAPAFIFPLNQQGPPANAASVRPAKSSVGTNASGVSSAIPSSATMSFNYPNMAAPNESQYLAILPNNGYPFPVPPPSYHGAPPQAMPMFNGSSFYSSQMILPAQLQQPPATQSQKLMPSSQSQQPRPQNGGPASGSGGTGNMNSHMQMQQPPHNQYVQPPPRPKHQEAETVGEDGARAVNMYGQSLGLQQIHPQNFTFMENKAYPTQQGLKSSAEPLPPSFAMSFGASINGTAACQAVDISSVAVQNHPMFQSSSETARQNIQLMAAQVMQKNSFRILEEAKSSGGADSSDDKKTGATKTLGHSIAFARSDLPDSPVVAPLQANNGSSSSNRSSSRPSTSNTMAYMQSQFQHQQQEHQRMSSTPVNRSKAPVTSNGSIYLEHPNSSPVKFPTTPSGFPQSLVQSSSTGSSPNHWKRSSSSQAPPSSLGSSTVAAPKNLPQQHPRTPSGAALHTQISFGGSPKTLSTSQGQGSPSTSSISKGASGSPKMAATPASVGGKIGQGSSISAQPSKNSASNASQKPVSVLGNNPHIAAAAAVNTAGKNQMPQSKPMHQAQLFFSNPYAQSQSPHSNSSSTSSPGGGGGYYMSKRAPPPTTSGAMPASAHAGTVTNDPTKAIAATASNVKGGGAPQFAAQSAGTVLPAGFSYLHPVPAAVQVKPAEQKQPAA